MSDQRSGVGHHEIWEIPCGQLVLDQQVVVVNAESSIEDACQILVTNGITSAPVWDQSSNSFTGMIDYRDVVTFILLALHKKTRMENNDVKIQQLIEKAAKHEVITAKLTSDLSRKNPFNSIMANTPLSHAIDFFSKGVHRVVVMGQSGVRGILSQSTVLAYIWKNLYKYPMLESRINESLKSFGLGPKKVITVEEDEIVLDCLHTMSVNEISSVAVLKRGTGVIVGNLSMSDIKWIMKSGNVSFLYNTALHFVSYVDQEQGLATGKDRYPVFSVTEETTLKQTIGKAVATRAHRIWVIDREGRCNGVVSLTDIMGVLSRIA